MACQIILIRERTGNGSTQIYLSFMSNFQPVGVTWNNRQNPAKMKQSADQDNEAILSKEKYFTL